MNKYLNRYSVREMVIPRTTKVVIKIFMFNIIDLLIVFFVTLIGIKISSAIPTNPFFQIGASNCFIYSWSILCLTFCKQSWYSPMENIYLGPYGRPT